LKRKSTNGSGSREENLNVQANLSNLNLDKGGDIYQDKTINNKEATKDSYLFGFDNVYKEYKRLYLSAISTTIFDKNNTEPYTQPLNTKLYIGSIAYISPNLDCSICRKLFDVT